MAEVQKPIAWTTPPPGKVSSEIIGQDILSMLSSIVTGRAGKDKPLDIKDGEYWTKINDDGTITMYRWTLADGDTDGTPLVNILGGSETAKVGGFPIAMDDGGGNIVFDDSWKGIFGGVEITQTINSDPTQASAEKIPSEKAVSMSLQGKANVSDVATLEQSVESVETSLGNKANKDLSNVPASAFPASTGAPLPQTAAGVGQFVGVNVEADSYVLPSGGTWMYSLLQISEGNTVTRTYNGIQSGGSIVTTASGAVAIRGWVWRIA